MRFLAFFLISNLLVAGDLQTQLLENLEKTGEPQYSNLEIAFIASGATDSQELESLKTAYEQLLADLKLPEKLAKQSSKKKVKQIQKALFNRFKKEGGASATFIDLVKSERRSKLTATYFFLDLAKQEGLANGDLATKSENLEPAFLGESPSIPREIISAFLVEQAATFSVERATGIRKALKLSERLAPKSTYGTDRLDRTFYNIAIKAYQDKAYMKSATIAAGASLRFPNLKELNNVCFNSGLQLFKSVGTQKNYEEVLELGHALSPFTGENQSQFEAMISTTRYNYGVGLYNAKNYEQAYVQFEKAIHYTGDNRRRLLISSLSLTIGDMAQAGRAEEAQALLEKLEELDPEEAELARRRLAQLQLKVVDNSGDFKAALKLASKDVVSEIGRKNYLSVLTRYIQSLRTAGKLKEAFSALDQVHDTVKNDTILNDLRYNTYIIWLDRFDEKNYAEQLPIFKALFNDKKLTLQPEDESTLRENYGNALYREIEYLIGEQHFKEADQKSRVALKIAPKHDGLLQQRHLIDRILKRIGG